MFHSIKSINNIVVGWLIKQNPSGDEKKKIRLFLSLHYVIIFILFFRHQFENYFIHETYYDFAVYHANFPLNTISIIDRFFKILIYTLSIQSDKTLIILNEYLNYTLVSNKSNIFQIQTQRSQTVIFQFFKKADLTIFNIISDPVVNLLYKIYIYISFIFLQQQQFIDVLISHQKSEKIWIGSNTRIYLYFDWIQVYFSDILNKNYNILYTCLRIDISEKINILYNNINSSGCANSINFIAACWYIEACNLFLFVKSKINPFCYFIYNNANCFIFLTFKLNTIVTLLLLYKLFLKINNNNKYSFILNTAITITLVLLLNYKNTQGVWFVFIILTETVSVYLILIVLHDNNISINRGYYNYLYMYIVTLFLITDVAFVKKYTNFNIYNTINNNNNILTPSFIILNDYTYTSTLLLFWFLTWFILFFLLNLKSKNLKKNIYGFLTSTYTSINLNQTTLNLNQKNNVLKWK